MTAAPPAAAGSGPNPPSRRWIRQPVLALLLAGLAAALLGLPFLSIAPNRLVSGEGLPLQALHSPFTIVLLAPIVMWLLALRLPPSRMLHLASAAAAGALVLLLVALAGTEASRRAATLPELARISLGSGFWLALLLAWAAFADAWLRLRPGRFGQAGAHALLGVALLAMLAGGLLDSLSLLVEYRQRADVFGAAMLRHLQIVAATLFMALALGVPLGIAAARRPGLARPLLAALGLVQTVPSIAMFGLLIGPLAWLGQAWPASGVKGIGQVPAVLALTLYSLLPVVHGIVSGLQQVPEAVRDAARGMGMSARQRFWHVEWPLALPVLLSALRLTTVQVVGLAVVAALIGAGGLGAIIFQGLLASALDLVLLGVLPVVGLALVVDAAFRLVTPAERAP